MRGAAICRMGTRHPRVLQCLSSQTPSEGQEAQFSRGQQTMAQTPAENDIELAKAATKLRNTFGGHWGEHPDFPLESWIGEVKGENTRLGYWEWIASSMPEISDQEPGRAIMNGREA